MLERLGKSTPAASLTKSLLPNPLLDAPRRNAPALMARVERTAGPEPEMEILIMGPPPPYPK